MYQGILCSNNSLFLAEEFVVSQSIDTDGVLSHSMAPIMKVRVERTSDGSASGSHITFILLHTTLLQQPPAWSARQLLHPLLHSLPRLHTLHMICHTMSAASILSCLSSERDIWPPALHITFNYCGIYGDALQHISQHQFQAFANGAAVTLVVQPVRYVLVPGCSIYHSQIVDVDLTMLPTA